MTANQLKRGHLVEGHRVVGMIRGLLNGDQVVSITLTNGQRRTYRLNAVVPGTRPRTDIPAGPVGSERGTKSMTRGRGRTESGGDYHSRLMDGLIYG